MSGEPSDSVDAAESADSGVTATDEGTASAEPGADDLGPIGRFLFGDRLGLALFLGMLCVVTLAWRTEVFITDNEVLVRALDSLASGQIYIEEVTDDTPFDGPGAEIRDGFVYARNYGQLFVSLPALLLVRALDFAMDLRVGLVALWHLTALAFVAQVGRLTERSVVTVAGSALVVALFVANLALATSFVEARPALYALQLTSTVAAGFVAVLFYRLVAFQFDRQLGVLAGVAGVAVLPVGFWATIPKRHVFSVLVCVGVLYLFALSRDDGGTELPVVGTVPAYRAGAYVLVAFLTWIHAAEGLFVFLALAAVDLPTAPRNDRRSLAFVAGVFALALVPTVVTNLLVTGSPVRPPRTLGGGGLAGPATEAAEGITSGDSGGTEGGSGGTEGDSGGFWGLPGVALLTTLLSAVTWLFGTVIDLSLESVRAAGDFGRMSATFVRSAGATITGGRLEFADTNLSVLEAAPILGAAVGAAAVGLWRTESRPSLPAPTTVLAGGLTVAFLLIYLSRLPLHVMVTQRYILPVFPLLLYLLVRTGAGRELVVAPKMVYWAFAGTVLLGGQVFVAYIVAQDLAVAEAVQLHARLALVCAGVLAVTVGVAGVTERGKSVAQVATGVACGLGTLFLLVGGLVYFAPVGDLMLPVVDTISDAI